MNREEQARYAGINRELLSEFRANVYDSGEIIDPPNEQDWYSLTLGWALGKGLDPAEAHEFATFVRYHTQMG